MKRIKPANASPRGDGTILGQTVEGTSSRAAIDDRRQRGRRDVPDALREDAFISANQFAELIGISKRQLYRWLESGYVPDYDLKIGQTCRWKISTVKAWQVRNNPRAA